MESLIKWQDPLNMPQKVNYKFLILTKKQVHYVSHLPNGRLFSFTTGLQLDSFEVLKWTDLPPVPHELTLEVVGKSEITWYSPKTLPNVEGWYICKIADATGLREIGVLYFNKHTDTFSDDDGEYYEGEILGWAKNNG